MRLVRTTMGTEGSEGVLCEGNSKAACAGRRKAVRGQAATRNVAEGRAGPCAGGDFK